MQVLGVMAEDESGGMAVEYALLIGLVALFIIGAITSLGLSVDGLLMNPDLTDALTP